MKKEDLRIVYMGTPDFAVESLRTLYESGYNVVGVVTMPDKPAGRGHKIQFSPVKQYALDNHLRLLQPEKLKDEAFLAELKSLQADLQIVVAFRMLPEVVWDMPKLGTFNLHASLLPQYRGAAPINWAIINGETETGVTTFFLTHEIDTGNIILQEKTPISSEENAGDIHDRLMKMGGELVLKTVDLILEGKAQGQAQAHIADLKPAPKIFKETCKIDWQKNTDEIYNFVRGLSPYPAAWTELKSPNGEVLTLKVFETKTEKTTHNEPVGTLLTDGKKFIKIAVSDGYLHLISIQLPSKKRMSAEDVLRGFNFAGFEIF
ncbi:MAG: methionyl-tRNA formyltransferase [Prevotellaceae bacterium]|jgi:methionyl-tRNA formyltransferase|nr:methionyl-tRNA formyltransferase [Prevotellaceae bacterium]